MAESAVKLYYYNCFGDAEPMRILLYTAGVPFTDVRFEHHEFEKVKQELGGTLDLVPLIVMPDGEQYA